MMLQQDLAVANQQHADLLREARNVRLAKQARGYAGNQPLISRMVMLLTALGERMHLAAQPKARLTRQGLAATKPC